MDQLSTEYSEDEAAFVEWHSGMPSNRSYLMSEAGGDHGQYVPEAMVDSGRLLEIGAGSTPAVTEVYRGMIEDSQDRAPQADITASVNLDGNQAIFSATVTNNSSVTLSTSNNAAVHGIVYEDYRASKSNFAGRGSARTVISSLAPGATASYTITVNLTGVVDPEKLHFIVVVDYKVATGLNVDTGVYDQLNAVRLGGSPFRVSPGSIEMDIKTADVTMPTAEVNVRGDSGQTWTASVDKDFVLLSKTSGDVPDSFEVTVDKSKLTVGTQTATITVDDGAGLYQKQIPVTVNFILSDFQVIPGTITFNFGPGDPLPSAGVMPRGDAGQTWVATANMDWVVLSATSGNVGTSFRVSVDPAKLSPGYQEAIVTVSDGGGYQSKEVKVKVTYHAEEPTDFFQFLPVTLKP